MSQRRRFVSLHTVYGRRIPAACGPFRTAPRGGGSGGHPRWALAPRSTLATETRASAARDAGARRCPPERSRERWSPRLAGRVESRGRCRPARRGVVGHVTVRRRSAAVSATLLERRRTGTSTSSPPAMRVRVSRRLGRSRPHSDGSDAFRRDDGFLHPRGRRRKPYVAIVNAPRRSRDYGGLSRAVMCGFGCFTH